MGPCVRLIRALGPRPELNEEEKRARWSAFKNKVKTEGLGLSEVKTTPPPSIQGQANEDFCFAGDNCTNITVSEIENQALMMMKLYQEKHC